MNILVLFSERRKIPNYLRNSFLSPVSGFNVVISYEVPFKSLSILYLPLEELFFICSVPEGLWVIRLFEFLDEQLLFIVTHKRQHLI